MTYTLEGKPPKSSLLIGFLWSYDFQGIPRRPKAIFVLLELFELARDIAKEMTFEPSSNRPIFVNLVEERLKCVACKDFLKDPVQSLCGHR